VAKGVIEITLDKQVQNLLSSIDKSLKAFSRIVGGGQKSKRSGEQVIRVKVVNWDDLWSSKEAKKVTKVLGKIFDNVSNLSKCCDKLSKSFENLGKTLSVSPRGGTGGGGGRRKRRVSPEETIEDLGKKVPESVGSLAEALLDKIGSIGWEGLGESLKEKLSEVLEEVGDEELLSKLLGRIGEKEWGDLEKRVKGKLGEILEEVDSEGLVEKLIDVIGDKGWRSLKDMEKELRDMFEVEKKVSLSSLMPKGSFLSPFAWSALGGLIGSVLGGLLSQVEKVKDEIGLDILAGRELAGTMELAAEMVSKTFSTASSAFQQTTYYLAQFGIGVGEAIGQVQELFAALGEGVKDFLSSGEAQKMLGYFTLLGVSAETTGGLVQQFRFLRGSVKDASKDFQSSAKMFLTAAKKMGVSVQQLVELQSRLLEGMYDIILAYRLTTQTAGLFGDQLTDNAKRFSVLGAALRQQGVAGAEEVSAALINLSAATNLGWEQIGKMGITLGVMGKEAEVSTLFISKMMGEMFGLQDIFKDTQGNISGVVKKFKEMDETSRMLAIALMPSLAPLFAIDEKVLKRLDNVSKEVETIQSQIRIVDSTLAAMKDKAKAVLASFFAVKGVNKIISDFSKAIDQAVSKIVAFLEKHEWLAKVLAILTTLSMVLGTVLLQLAPALIILTPAFIGVYEVGRKVFGFLGTLISGLISMLWGFAENFVEVFVTSFDLMVVTLKKFPTLLNKLGGSFRKVIDIAIKFYGLIKKVAIPLDKFLFRKIGGFYEFMKLYFRELGDVFVDFYYNVKDKVTALGEFIIKKLGKAFNFLSTIASKSFKLIGNALLAGINLTASLAVQFLVFGGIITWVSISLAALPVILSGFFGVMAGGIAVVGYLAKNFKQLKNLLVDLSTSSGVFFENLKNVWEVFMGILKGEKGLNDLVNAFERLFSAESVKGFKKLFDNLLKSGVLQQLVTTLLSVFIEGFINGFKMAWEFLYKFITGGGLQKIYEAIKNTLLSALSAGGEDFLKIFLDQFGQVVATIANLLVNIIVDITSVLPSLIEKLGGAIVNNILPTVFNVAIKLLNALPSILTKILMSIVSLLPKLFKFLAANISPLIKATATALANVLISLINEVVPALLEALVNALPDLISALGEAIGHVVDSLFEVLANIDWLKLLGSIIEAIFKIIFKVLPALLGSLIKILGKVLWSIVKTLWSWIWKPLGWVFKLFGKLVGIDVGEAKAAEFGKGFQQYEGLGENIGAFTEALSALGENIDKNTAATELNTDAIGEQNKKMDNLNKKTIASDFDFNSWLKKVLGDVEKPREPAHLWEKDNARNWFDSFSKRLSGVAAVTGRSFSPSVYQKSVKVLGDNGVINSEVVKGNYIVGESSVDLGSSGVVVSGLTKGDVPVKQSEDNWAAHLVDVGGKQLEVLTLIATHLSEIKSLLRNSANQKQDIAVNVYSLDENYRIRG
jgi:phage-related protein